MGEQFSIEHIAKAIEKLNEEPKQSIADNLKAYFIQILQNADFVQVVRCKECKYFSDNGSCLLLAGLTFPTQNEYCSYAERR